MVLIAIALLFTVDNAEFLNTAKEQREQGYIWEYIGKQEASGTPALLVDNKYIYYRLTKND